MKNLMIFVIGPVQDFIATARRSRDLWYGSWMLSELSRAAANVIDKSGELIFPSNPKNVVSVPNKIVATTDDPKAVAKAVDDAIKKRMEELRDEALGRVKSSTYDKELAKSQIEDLPELYWVSVPYQEDGYKRAREEAETLLSARKATRNFKQAIGSNNPKSSLDGSRESVIDEREYPQKNESNKADKVRKLYNNYHARQGERLSGVDLLKRMGGKDDEPDFKSTSHMAALPFIEGLIKKWGKKKTEVFIDSIRQLFVNKNWNIREENDGALLYESRLSDWVPAGKLQDELRKEFNKLLKDHLGDSRPSPYYVLLAADGDNMGKVIDAQKDEKAHRNLSQALSEFAEDVSNIVNTNNNGLLIYSGGDDVLAYLPINTALKCALELEIAFREKLPANKFSAIENDKTIFPTLSIGIVVAHHLDPLSDVLDMARTAEKKAKEKVDGKNGLAITLSKRSGVDRTIVGKWDDLYPRIDQLIQFINEKLISGGTAYELQELHRVLVGNIPKEGLVAEALRIVKHKQETGGGDISTEKRKTIESWIRTISLNELANEMIIAKALADTPEIEQPQEAQQ